MKRISLSLLLVLMMIISLFSTITYAADMATLTVNAGSLSNGKVEVKIDLSDNPGIAGIKFQLHYDNTKIVPESYEKYSPLGLGQCVMNYDQGNALESYEFASYNFSMTSNSKANGTLMKIVFKTISNDWEETPLTITYTPGNITDQAFNDVDASLVNATVGLPQIDFTFANATKIYNGEVQKLEATGLNGASVIYENNNNIDVGSYTVKATAKKDGFRATTKTATMTINPKTLTIAGISALNKTYDGTTNAIVSGGTLSGKIASDDVTAIMPESGTFVNANVGSNIAVSIADIALSGAKSKNYTLTQPSGLKANITTAPITVTADSFSIVKGGTIPTLTYRITVGKLMGSDTLSGTLVTNTNTSRIGTYDITQGTLKTSSNYSLQFVKGTISVVDKTPQNITVSDITEKTYGDSSFRVTATPDAISKLNSFTYTSSDPSVAEITADGTVTIKKAGQTTITVAQAGDDTYAPFTKSQELNINKVKINVTADAKTKRVGTSDPELTYTYTGSLVGSDKFTGVLSRTPGETVGKYNILQGTLTITNNYAITYNKAVLEVVDKTPQNITLSDITAKTYGDSSFKVIATPDATAKLSAFTYASSNSDVAEISADGIVTIKKAGTTSITVNEAGSDTYAPFTKSQELVVNKKALTITINNINATYGEEVNKTISYDGFIAGENEEVLTKPVIVSGIAAKPGVGEYDITLSGAEAINYEIYYVNAKLTVNKKDISITDMKVFDKKADESKTATINTSSIVFSGLIAGDDVLVDIANTNAEFASAEIGDDVAVAITNIALSGTAMENYNLITTSFNTTANIKADIKSADIAGQLLAPAITKNALSFVLPTVPIGFTVKIKSTDNSSVISADGTISPVDQDTVVNMIFEVVNENDSTDVADTATLAVTVPKSDKINVTVTSEENGTVTGNGAYIINTDVTVVATPNSGYTFNGWYENDTLVSSNSTYTFTATKDINLIAKFTVRRSSGGGSSSSSTYTLSFNTNGGSNVASVKVKRNEIATEPTAPTKEGYDFDGWYTDKELTLAFDFTAKVTKSTTLYAKWSEEDKSKNEIVLTIGSKAASVWGETKSNDVAPKIVNDRTMLPARFVAENLGATVEWNETAPGIVTITKDKTVIIIKIGEEYATVNGESVKLDSPAFIENDRTYTPIRFISENFGAKIEWNGAEQTVTITK